MDFEFDKAKSERSYQERGLDFVFACRLFDGPTVEFIDDRHDYGELRMIAIGSIDGRLYKVVYTDREMARRIISINPASRQERRLWPSSE